MPSCVVVAFSKSERMLATPWLALQQKRVANRAKLANSWHVELSRANHVDSEPSGESADTAPSRSHT